VTGATVEAAGVFVCVVAGKLTGCTCDLLAVWLFATAGAGDTVGLVVSTGLTGRTGGFICTLPKLPEVAAPGFPGNITAGVGVAALGATGTVVNAVEGFSAVTGATVGEATTVLGSALVAPVVAPVGKAVTAFPFLRTLTRTILTGVTTTFFFDAIKYF
jgi:hypothetical protein